MDTSRPDSELNALKLILAGTSETTGTAFFRSLVRALAAALHTDGAWVTEIDREAGELSVLAFWLDEGWKEPFRYAIAGTPCEAVILEGRTVHAPERVTELWPGDHDLRDMKAISYLGVPLLGPQGEVSGNLAVLHRRPMEEDPRALAIIRIFAARAAAEIARLRAEEQVRGLVNSAMDGIAQLDADFGIVRTNPAAQRTLRAPGEELVGRSFLEFLDDDASAKLRRYAQAVDARSRDRSIWISGGLRGARADGAALTAEASLARFESGAKGYMTLIFRDVDERIAAEREIASLREQAEALRAQLQSREGDGEIIGNAPCMQAMLEDIAQVARTDASVLVQGETGTGKELVARAIHEASDRTGKPLVRVNCGAIPAGLIESELFGHEKGAFTGATARRDGRFLLADGGTLFLDEVGELPLDLQVKLLRVLQEGEFEPVGSARTQQVDVRVIAATNRDLAAEVRAGRFRSDLYYRLNVFPIDVPPLRDRRDDIPLLAEIFTRRAADRLGRAPCALTTEDFARLREGSWPGNVRELMNVIERAAITARDGRLNLDRALPAGIGNQEPAPDEGSPARIRTNAELQALERANLKRALQQTAWKVSGADGAAALLGMKPSTLRYRIKALGITRPV
jgi:PAS domain S-box-containing protein